MMTLIKTTAQEEACKHTLMTIIGFDIYIGSSRYLTVYLTTNNSIEIICEDIANYIEAIKTYLFIKGYEYNYLKGLYYVNKFI